MYRAGFASCPMTGEIYIPQTMNEEKRGGEQVVLVKERFRGFQLPKLSVKELNKDQKGLTLIELLAVIVILAIIAAIAIPSIGGILKNSRISAHKSNAHMIIDAARLNVSGEGLAITGATNFTLDDLNKAGYLETIPKNPSDKGNTYDPTGSYVTVDKNTDGNYIYKITLQSKSGHPYLSDVEESAVDTSTITE